MQILGTTKLTGRGSSVHTFYGGVISITRITTEDRDTLLPAFLQPLLVMSPLYLLYDSVFNHLNQVIVD